MNIDQLIDTFARMKGAEVGRGPQHPVLPDTTISTKLSEFIERYPFILQDNEYIEFLTKYSGAFCVNNQDGLTIDIWGLADGFSNLLDEDGPVIDEDGYCLFAYILFNNQSTIDTEVDFKFDATGKRKWGIYRSVDDENGKSIADWYCESFLDWLEQLILKNGKLL
jgi:hypothetical protein